MPRRNIGQVAHVSSTPWVTSQEADITRRTPEAACWFRLGCWRKNSANSHPSLGALNRRAPQCSCPPHRSRHQRLANCDWMPASYTSGQPSSSRRHPTCWASSHWLHTISSTPCRGTWTSAPLSAHPSIECKRTAPKIETLICMPRTTSHQFIWKQQRTCGAVGGLPMEFGVDRQPEKTPHFHHPHRHPPSRNDPPKKNLGPGFNCLRTGVGRFRICLYKWGMASSAACECGAEEQTIYRVVLQCPIHRPLHGLHGLTVPDDERQPNGCSTPAPKSSAAKQWIKELAQTKEVR